MREDGVAPRRQNTAQWAHNSLREGGYLRSMRYFHGDLMSAEYSVRAWALLHNFTPYGARAKVADQYQSPAHKLNDYTYHENWLQNLLVAASISGYRQ